MWKLKRVANLHATLGSSSTHPMDVAWLSQVTNVGAFHDHLEHEDLL